VSRFSENRATGNKNIEDVSSAPIPTKKDEDILALIGDGSIDRSALQDMGAWPIRISDSFRDFMVKRGTNQLQNSGSHFPEKESERSLTKHWSEKKLENGENVHRTWMCFSPKEGALFCFCCTLFNQKYPNQRSKFNSENRFTTWRKLNPSIQDHEIALHIAQHF
jgi:hypothetical protein